MYKEIPADFAKWALDQMKRERTAIQDPDRAVVEIEIYRPHETDTPQTDQTGERGVTVVDILTGEKIQT